MSEVAFFLSEKLSQLVDYWLALRCCGYTTYPLRLLHMRHPADVPLEMVIDRLRCRTCGGLSKEIYITDEPRGLLPGQNESTYLHLLLKRNA